MTENRNTPQMFAEQLRQAADIIDKLPAFVEADSSVTISMYLPSDATPEQVAQAAAAFGTFTKRNSDYFVNLDRHIADNRIRLHLGIWHESVCERVVETVEVEEDVEIEPAVIAKPAVTEKRKVQKEIVKWKCPETLLNPAQEVNK